MDLYLEDILNYSNDDLGDTQSLYTESDSENESQDYYSQYQSFSYFKNRISPKPISKTHLSNFQNKPLSYIYKHNPEYKEIFTKDFFANCNKLKSQKFLNSFNKTQIEEI